MTDIAIRLERILELNRIVEAEFEAMGKRDGSFEKLAEEFKNKAMLYRLEDELNASVEDL